MCSVGQGGKGSRRCGHGGQRVGIVGVRWFRGRQVCSTTRDAHGKWSVCACIASVCVCVRIGSVFVCVLV